MLSGVEARPGKEVGGAESCEMKDSAAGLEIMLCRLPPVTGLEGIKLTLLVSDLATGFSLAPCWPGQCCPP